MKRSISLLGVMLMIAGAAYAQEGRSEPTLEFGFDYSLLHSTAPGGGSQITSNGGSGYFVYNVSRVLGLVADIGAYRNGTVHGAFNGETSVTYLFGPRFSLRWWARVTPYTQFLFGGARISAGLANPAVASTSSENSFALAAGGGIDVSITPHVAIKPVQIEYAMTQASDFAGSRIGVQNGFRYSAGVVFRFGDR